MYFGLLNDISDAFNVDKMQLNHYKILSISFEFNHIEANLYQNIFSKNKQLMFTYRPMCSGGTKMEELTETLNFNQSQGDL